MSTLSCSSAVWESEAEILKKARSNEGTESWCLASHKGVKTPSGKMGELGESGERGECSSAREAWLLMGGMPSVDGDCGSGAAFRGGRVYV